MKCIKSYMNGKKMLFEIKKEEVLLRENLSR